MTIIQTILATGLMAIWLCVSIMFLICSIQSFINDRKREKRELEQEQRDREYHEERMKNLMK